MVQTIKIKRSTSTATPTALANGELAYSATSGGQHKLFIGRPGGGSGDIDAIGGAYYTALIDAATNANTASAIVKRDGSGNFAAGTITAALSGNASTASALASARTIALTGDVTGSVSFDGSANASISTTIAANSIALGTDTTGNYVATVAGTANEIEVSGSGSETAAVTIGLPSATKVTTSLEVGGADGVTIEDGSVSIKNSGTQSKVDFYCESSNAHYARLQAPAHSAFSGNVTSTLPAVTGTLISTGDTGTVSATMLAATSVSAGSYGSSTQVPTFTVDADGRLTAAGTAAISTSLVVAADSGSADTVAGGETLTFEGDTGITTTVSNNKISIDLDDTSVTAGSYGSATAVPTFTVDGQGRLTAAGTAAISTSLAIQADSGTADSIALGSETLDIAGGTGITSSSAANSSTVTLTLDNTAVSAGTYGSTTAIPTFTVDAQGRLTAAGSAAVTAGFTLAGDSGTSGIANGDTATVSGGTGVTTAVSGDEVTISIGQAVATTSNVTFNNVQVDGTLSSDDITAANMTASGNVIVTGNLTVNGTTTTVNSNTVAIGDNIIVLNSDETGTPSQNAGIEIERGTATNVLIRWNETTDRFQFTNDGSTYFNIPLSTEYDKYTSFTVSDGSNSTAITSAATLTFAAAGGGLSVAESSGTVTYTIGDATAAAKGVASFNSSDFTVSSGAVSLTAVDGGTY